MNSDDRPRRGRPRYADAMALEMNVCATRRAQAKKTPGDFTAGTPEWDAATKDFLGDIYRAIAAILLSLIIQTDWLPTGVRTRAIKIIRQNTRLQNYFHRVRLRARPAISGRSVSPSRGYACGFFLVRLT
ncbi:hypothetical protein IQ289_36310 [Burkholderia sp. R-70006]|uniref:hypothetical protein n=1 Tax=Paraburkholderia domus TaxID=2793075 RepID=UPI001912A2FD|nr:hypothetical protein [Paraburkholderia domus]MBK5053834.1 hypothetical protein [Burkholderia sp. R-70006]